MTIYPHPVPAGFPRCGRCPYRLALRPEVCLACMRGAGEAPAAADRRGCAACGQALPHGGACTNPWCGRVDRSWSVAFSIGVHTGALRRVLVEYKYRRRVRWAPVLARLVAGWLLAHQPWLEDFDLLVPAPAFTGPGARRAWDPVGELAALVAGLVGPLWEVAAGAVVKTAETPPMTGRSGAARVAVAEGPLRACLAVPRPDRVAGARVLVLDDVLTEGATLREVARALRAAGAREVAGLAVTRPARRPPPPGPAGAPTVAGCHRDWSR